MNQELKLVVHQEAPIGFIAWLEQQFPKTIVERSDQISENEVVAFCPQRSFAPLILKFEWGRR